MLALATPALIILGALLLFALLVVLRLVLDLVKQAKGLAETASVATGRLRAATREVEAEAAKTRERAERIGRRRGKQV